MRDTNTFKSQEFNKKLNGMDESADAATRFPEWRAFDGANERFVRTPAESRLAPPVLVRTTPVGPFAIVFPELTAGARGGTRACSGDASRSVHSERA